MYFKYFILSFLVVISLFFVTADGSHNKVVMCYYGTWAVYRPGNGRVQVGDIDPFLCTHLIYTFVGIQDDGSVVSLDSYLDLASGLDNFNKFNALKNQNPNLKTLLAVGGWNEGSAKYSIMASNADYRQNFINTSLNFITEYGFDGFDLDWEYPARRDTVYGVADIENFSTLVKEMKEAFEPLGLLLTAAVSSVEQAASLSYNIPVISKYLDYINIMAYDLYGSWDAVTGHNAPLYPGEGDENADPSTVMSVDAAIEYWLSAGAPANKLVLGVPFYGHTLLLTDANNNGVRAPSSGAGFASEFTQTAGTIGYNEMCSLLLSSDWEVRKDELAKVPYAVSGINWVSYDDVWSITEKVKYALSKDLAGVMMWSIETDDIFGLCGETWPLLKAINSALEGSQDSSASTTTVSTTTTSSTTISSSTATSEASTTTTQTETPSTESIVDSPSSTELPTSTASPTETICQQEGFAANPADCGSFYMCVANVYGDYSPVYFNCPSGLHWDETNLVCNLPELANCQI